MIQPFSGHQNEDKTPWKNQILQKLKKSNSIKKILLIQRTFAMISPSDALLTTVGCVNMRPNTKLGI